MIVRYPGGATWQVAEGSKKLFNPEEQRLWVFEPSGRVRSFGAHQEFAVLKDDAKRALSLKIALTTAANLMVDAVEDEPEQQEEESAPAPRAAEPYTFLPRPEDYRKHHVPVSFYGSYVRAVPTGSRYKVSPRGVVVVTPIGRVTLYGPLGRVRLTAVDEKGLAASVPLSLRRR